MDNKEKKEMGGEGKEGKRKRGRNLENEWME